VVGYKATATDAALFAALGKAPDAKKYANVARFYSHMASYAPAALAALPAAIGGGAAGPAVAAAAPKAAKEEEEVDLFGDDGDAAAAKVAAPVAAAPAAAKKEKAKPIAKSICTYDVKPQDDTIKMADMEAAIRAIKIDGLVWGQTFEVKDVAFGIQKLMVQFVCEDEKVSLDDVEEQMQSIPNPHKQDAEDPDERLMVQSVDQLSMNKLG
jgi:elongation factor 1-beta